MIRETVRLVLSVLISRRKSQISATSVEWTAQRRPQAHWVKKTLCARVSISVLVAQCLLQPSLLPGSSDHLYMTTAQPRQGTVPKIWNKLPTLLSLSETLLCSLDLYILCVLLIFHAVGLEPKVIQT